MLYGRGSSVGMMCGWGYFFAHNIHVVCGVQSAFCLMDTGFVYSWLWQLSFMESMDVYIH